jgi:GWxTD domain-containing protein
MHQIFNWRLVCGLVLLVTVPSTGQVKPPKDSLKISIDYCRFRGDDKSVFVEVYYSIPQSALAYRQDPGGFKAETDITLLVMSKDSVAHADRWLVPHVIRDTANLIGGMNLVGMASFSMREGDFLLKMIARDRNTPGRRDSVMRALPLRCPPPEKVAMSDLEFASVIKKGEKGGMFYKNTLDVIPNVDGIFREDQQCFFYTEAYNLAFGEGHGDYYVKSSVYDAVGKEVISREKPKRPVGESSVIVDNLGIDKLRMGVYSLVITLLDSTKKSLVSTGKKFYVYNPRLGIDSSLLTASTAMVSSEYATMEEPELDREFKWAKYEATDAEKAQYEMLKGIDAKRKFVSDFWRRRPLGLKEEYLSRIAHANANFAALGREGYRTDRGRVYIVYGPPDDYERHPNEAESKPYEIWTYNAIQGGVIFVFAQRQSGGEFELVHSTHRNELHDENWQQYIMTQ